MQGSGRGWAALRTVGNPSRTSRTAVSTHGPASANASSLGLSAVWRAVKTIRGHAGPRSSKPCPSPLFVFYSLSFLLTDFWVLLFIETSLLSDAVFVSAVLLCPSALRAHTLPRGAPSPPPRPSRSSRSRAELPAPAAASRQRPVSHPACTRVHPHLLTHCTSLFERIPHKRGKRFQGLSCHAGFAIGRADCGVRPSLETPGVEPPAREEVRPRGPLQHAVHGRG